MSLINEALKKAQRRQHEQQAAAGMESDEGSMRSRRKTSTAQIFIVIGAGAAALVVVSVVMTVVWLNRASEQPERTPIAKAAPPPVSNETASPIIVAPAVVKPVEDDAPSSAPASIEATPPGVAISQPAVRDPEAKAKADAETNFTDTAAATSRPPIAIPQIAGPTMTEQVQAFVDAVRVTGIRSSGADSKVLMNDRVYRVNDIVDRALGVKLVRVESERLIFADADGMTYEKPF